ncbi:hypothetical protein [Streptomyces sp. NPDC015414]|uniref:hypothetical protein n=1 Tax=unclassified Streptomyces TaxID=2593676 RepID=UPI0036F86252
MLRTTWLLVTPAVGYVALLTSSLLGGPTISAPFVPRTHPADPASTHVSTAPPTSGSARSAEPAAAHKNTATAVPSAAAPSRTSATATAPAATSRTPPTPTETFTQASAPAPSTKGRALGSSHRPSK